MQHPYADPLEEAFASKAVGSHIARILSGFCQPRILNREDTAFDIGYEKAKADLSAQLRAEGVQL